MAAIRRAEMARAAEILGVQHRWLGFVDSGLPEGDPKPPLPEGCFALVDLDEATEPLVAAHPRVPPARRSSPTTRTAATRTPTTSRRHEISMAAFDAAGDPDRFPGCRRALAAAEALLLARLLPRPASSRSTRRCWRAGWSRRTRSGWRTGPPTGRDPATRVTTRVECADWFDRARRGAARARHPDRSRRAAGSSCRATCSARSGPPRTTSSSARLVDTPMPEDDLFAGHRRPRGGRQLRGLTGLSR